MPNPQEPSDEAKAARERAAVARREAEESVATEATALEDTVSVFRRLRDHGRADTFTAMIQYELTRRRREAGGV